MRQRHVITSMTDQDRIRHFLTSKDSTLIRCLEEVLGSNIDEVRQLMSFGAVYLERRRTTSDCPVSPGQYVRVHLKPRRFPIDGIDWRKTIVHEDEEFVVVNKPAGIPVHATLDNGV